MRAGRIVALRALGLGDLLTVVPALRALRAAQGGRDGVEVVVAAPAELRPIAELAGCALVDAQPLQPLAPELHGADLLVNLHGRGPQSHGVALAARPRRLIAFAHPDVPQSAGMPAWRPDEHEVARWCRLLTASGIPADPSRLELPAPPLPGALAFARGATVVHPGAASPARRWPAERFAAVAAAQARAGHEVVVTGGPAERGIAEEVARRAGLPQDAVLAGRTDLAQLAAVVAHSGRVVCGDTGVAHLATAFARPSVLLFGPTSPAIWGPPTPPTPPTTATPLTAPGPPTAPSFAAGRHRVLWAGRTGDPHADRPHPGLLEIQPRHVLAELTELPS
jgi:ADP-heptose:LPS heptosyltransferase